MNVDAAPQLLPDGVHPPPPSALPPPPSSWLVSPQRLSAAASAPRREKLLVLDLNGLLVWRTRKKASWSRAPDLTAGKFYIFLRPHVREFLAWCGERFCIVVWSTTQRRNLEPIIQLAFAGLPPPRLVLDQQDCTDTGVAHPDEPSGMHMLFLKDLARLWSNPSAVTQLGKQYGPHDTLLLDDSPYKTLANPPHTAIHPKEWLGPSDADSARNNALGATGEVRSVLAAVATADDVRDVVRRLSGGDSGAPRLDGEQWTAAASDALLDGLRASRPGLCWREAQA